MTDEENPDEAQAAAMAEMEAMVNDGEAAQEPAGEVGEEEGEEDARVLNQDEIDLLLGFDGGEKTEDNTSGIFAILDKSLMAYEKLPMLEVVFDRLVRMLSSSLRNFTSENVEVSVDSMTSLRFDDYLNSIPLPAMLVVFRAVEWENFGIVTIDSSQIYSMVDVLFGGGRTHKPIRIEGRPYTTIEQDIVKKVSELLLTDMSGAFDPLSPVSFQFDRLESNPRFATITRPNNAALLVRLRIDMDERGGNIEILFPHPTLEPIRDLLLQMFMGEKFGHDAVWERQLGKEFQSADVELEVLLDRKKLSLGDIVNFEVGSTVMLNCKPEDDVQIVSGGVSLATGKLGRIGDTIAVSLSSDIGKLKGI